jgi:hypothetical protein
MADEHAIARYRHWYRKLLRLYSRPHRERFGQSMEQTFNDLCRERAKAGEGLGGLVFWMFVETSAGILREERKGHRHAKHEHSSHFARNRVRFARPLAREHFHGLELARVRFPGLGRPPVWHRSLL